ncbi:MAG: hypothetical protein HW403_251 [Dehalococcoidia bacterium]|nr:hypothetical protein [Dehalococcoidia bacterium]
MDLRVAVIMEKSLLEHGVVQRLLENPEVTVQVMNRDCADIDAALAAFQPDVAIIDETYGPLREQVLVAFPQSAVVTLSIDRADATVYRARRLAVKTVTELVAHLKRDRRRGAGSRRVKQTAE